MPPYTEIDAGHNITASQLADIHARLVSAQASSQRSITDVAMPPGKYFYSPGGDIGYYPNCWMRDFAMNVEYGMPVTEDEVFTVVRWWNLHQIKNDTTHYTGPASSVDLIYALGAVPDNIAANGTSVFIPGGAAGDRPSLDNHFWWIILAWQWGRLRSWDTTWLAWFSAVEYGGQTNSYWIEAAFNAVPYNATTKRIKQWHTYPGTTWG